MYRNEAQFRDFVKQKLEELGYQVGSEVIIYKRKKVDLLAKMVGKTSAIEVKLRDRRKIADDISKLRLLKFLPDIDFFYVATPKIILQDDILGFAKKVGVGIIGVTEQGIEWLISSEEEAPAHLTHGMSYPNAVSLGEIFEITIRIYNEGCKMARNIEIMYMPAFPFRVPKGERNHKFIKELKPKQKGSVVFKVKVREDAELGEYSFYTRTTVERLQPRESLTFIEVKELREHLPTTPRRIVKRKKELEVSAAITKRRLYRMIGLAEDLYLGCKEIVDLGKHGYNSVSEMVHDATRRRLEELRGR